MPPNRNQIRRESKTKKKKKKTIDNNTLVVKKTFLGFFLEICKHCCLFFKSVELSAEFDLWGAVGGGPGSSFPLMYTCE